MYRCRITTFTYLLILLMLILSTTIEVSGFGRPRRQHRNKSAVQSQNSCSQNLRESIENSSSTINDTAGEAKNFRTDFVDPYYDNCGIIEFGLVQKIPYQNAYESSGHNSLDVNFSNDACMKCGICIAISERINQSLIIAHDVLRTDEWLDDKEAELFLRDICDHEFRHYSLREYDDKRYIGDGNDVPGSISVTSSADGKWETALKKKCHEILDDVDPRKLYKYWRTWCDSEISKKLVDIICRSEDSGRLRDCINLDNDLNQYVADDDDAAPADVACPQSYDDHTWQARVKVTAQIASR